MVVLFFRGELVKKTVCFNPFDIDAVCCLMLASLWFPWLVQMSRAPVDPRSRPRYIVSCPKDKRPF